MQYKVFMICIFLLIWFQVSDEDTYVSKVLRINEIDKFKKLNSKLLNKICEKNKDKNNTEKVKQI